MTLVEYGDLECPYCGQAETAIRELLSDFGDLRYVWRHLPLNDVHPHAQLAAEASEAAAAQGTFWEMHDTMLAHQGDLTLRAIIGYAQDLGLDIERFKEHLRKRKGAAQDRRGCRVGRHERRVGDARRSSSTATATRTPTTWRHCPRRCGWHGRRAADQRLTSSPSSSSSPTRKALFAGRCTVSCMKPTLVIPTLAVDGRLCARRRPGRVGRDRRAAGLQRELVRLRRRRRPPRGPPATQFKSVSGSWVAADRQVHQRCGLLGVLGRARRLGSDRGAGAGRHRGRLLRHRQPRPTSPGTSWCPPRRSR